MVSADATSAEQHDHVTLSSTSSLCDAVCISLDLENKSLELLNRPATVGVNVEVKYAWGSNISLSTLFSNLIDGSDDFAVDLSKNLSRENICEFASAFRPWIAFRSCASSKEYSAFSALDLAVTVTFSIENAISLKDTPAWRSSESAVSIPCPTEYALLEALGSSGRQD